MTASVPTRPKCKRWNKANRANRRSFRGRSTLDTGNRVVEEGERPSHVVKFVLGCRVQVEVPFIVERAFRQRVTEEDRQVIWNLLRPARKLAGDSHEVVDTHLFRVHPSALREDRMVGRAADRHSIGEVESTHWPHPARAHRARPVGAVLGEHQVAGPHLGDGLLATVGHLDAGLGGQALVEPVARELLDEVPDALGLPGVDLVALAARDELLALGGHQLAVLLPHRLAERVGLA